MKIDGSHYLHSLKTDLFHESATPIVFCGSKHLQLNQIMERTKKCVPQNYIMSKDTNEIKEGHCIENVR